MVTKKIGQVGCRAPDRHYREYDGLFELNNRG